MSKKFIISSFNNPLIDIDSVMSIESGKTSNSYAVSSGSVYTTENYYIKFTMLYYHSISWYYEYKSDMELDYGKIKNGTIEIIEL